VSWREHLRPAALPGTAPECTARHALSPEVREVSQAEAGRLLRDAIASFWTYGAGPGADRGERYGLLCSSLAIASARAVVLAAGGAVTDAAAQRWPAEARRALVEEFLASPRAAELPDPAARTVPHLLAMCCVGTSGASRC
jgi:hypothetical protein